MNAKICKRLRKQAKRATMGKPHVSYLRHRINGMIILHPECTRAVYRQLKRAA